MDFGKGKGGWFFYFAKAKMRGPAYVDLRSQSGTWDLDFVVLEGVGKNLRQEVGLGEKENSVALFSKK